MLSFNQSLAYMLGYNTRDFDPLFTTNPLQFPSYTTDDILYIQGIINKISSIEAELEQNRPDAMANEVGGVKVDFGKSISISKMEGSRLLNLLSQVAAIPIKYDRFMGRKPDSFSRTPLVVRNYF
jgi:hypothetical protein